MVGANRYQNPDLDLPTDFEQARADYYEALKQPTEATIFVEQARTALQQALRSLDAAMPRLCPRVKILPRRNGWIYLSPLEVQPEPTNLALCWLRGLSVPIKMLF